MSEIETFAIPLPWALALEPLTRPTVQFVTANARPDEQGTDDPDAIFDLRDQLRFLRGARRLL